MVSLRRRRLILGLEPGKDNPLPLYCENIPPRGRFKRKPKTENESSDSEDCITPNDRMSSSARKGQRLRRNKAGKQNRGQGGCAGKATVPFSTQWPAASSSSTLKNKTGAEPSPPEVKLETHDKKDDKPIDPPSAVVCDNFTIKSDNFPPKLSGMFDCLKATSVHENIVLVDNDMEDPRPYLVVS